MTVVYLKDWRGRSRKPSAGGGKTPVQPPPMHPPGEVIDEEHRRRMRQNFGAMAVVAVIVVLGGWLMERLQAYSRMQACFDYGHHNCMPLNVDTIADRRAR